MLVNFSPSVMLAMIVQKLKFTMKPGMDIKRRVLVTLLPTPDVLVNFMHRE